MKVSIQEILNFEKFYFNMTTVSLPIMTSYKLNKIFNALSDDLSFYRSELQKAIEDCGQLDENGKVKYTEDGQNILLLENKTEEFGARFQELINMQIDVDDELQIDVSLLGEIKLTPAELMQIQKFIQ